MKSAVVYESEFGDTRTVAHAIASVLSSVGPVELLDVRVRPLSELMFVNLLVVGGPTQAHGLSPVLHTKLDALGKDALEGIQAAAFDTRMHGPAILTGSAAHGIASRLRSKGAQLVGETASFLVSGREGPLSEGELDRARAWARTLLALAIGDSLVVSS